VALRLRSCVLLAAGALGLHQLRYSLAYGAGAERALKAQGHAYLGPVSAAVVGSLILALAVALRRLAEGRRAGAAATLPRLWTAATASLLAVYCAQESIEGAIVPGHPGGVAALTAHRGWIAAPLAVALGLLVALGLRGRRAAGEVVTHATRRLAVRPRLRAAAVRLLLPPAPAPRRLPTLALAAAGRAPPAAS
jgi:hypothetical protein